MTNLVVEKDYLGVARSSKQSVDRLRAATLSLRRRGRRCRRRTASRRQAAARHREVRRQQAAVRRRQAAARHREVRRQQAAVHLSLRRRRWRCRPRAVHRRQAEARRRGAVATAHPLSNQLEHHLDATIRHVQMRRPWARCRRPPFAVNRRGAALRLMHSGRHHQQAVRPPRPQCFQRRRRLLVCRLVRRTQRHRRCLRAAARLRRFRSQRSRSLHRQQAVRPPTQWFQRRRRLLVRRLVRRTRGQRHRRCLRAAARLRRSRSQRSRSRRSPLPLRLKQKLLAAERRPELRNTSDASRRRA